MDLEGQTGVDFGARGGRRRARRKASSAGRRGRQRNVCVDFFRAIWYLIKLLLWDLPCCFISCGQETVNCFRACRGGDSSDEEDADYQQPPASKRSRTAPPDGSVDQQEVARLRAEVNQLRKEQQQRR